MSTSYQKFTDSFVDNEAWPYLVLILFISFVQVQVSADLHASSFFMWILIFSLIYLPIILYGYIKGKMQALRMKRWSKVLFWVASFFIFPILIFIICSKTPIGRSIDPLTNYHFLKNSDELLVVTLPLFALLHLLLQVSKRRDYRSAYQTWIKNLSFFKISIFGVLLISLVLPLISNEFQTLARESSLQNTLLKYLYFVPQVFLIYISYYLFYYINHHFLFLRIFEQKGLIYYIVGLCGLIFTLTPILTFLIDLMPVVSELRVHPIGAGISIFDVTNFLFPFLVTLLSFPIIAVIEWNKKEIALKELQKQKTKAELSLLKQQINPHFFFNTLNNLYALSLDQAKETPATILKLSQLMRFVIYKGQQDAVPIKEELAYIQDYIDLQKIRFKQSIDIKFSIEIEDSNTLVPPLLLINLLENAFKHGIEPTEKAGYIHLSAILTDNNFSFECKNSLDPESENANQAGTGLVNLRKRLDIKFPDRHGLETTKEFDNFIAKLWIRL